MYLVCTTWYHNKDMAVCNFLDEGWDAMNFVITESIVSQFFEGHRRNPKIEFRKLSATLTQIMINWWSLKVSSGAGKIHRFAVTGNRLVGSSDTAKGYFAPPRTSDFRASRGSVSLCGSLIIFLASMHSGLNLEWWTARTSKLQVAYRLVCTETCRACFVCSVWNPQASSVAFAWKNGLVCKSEPSETF